MADKPKRPPEGELIARARKSAGLSGRAAARRAGLSEGRWRQIENGYQVVTKGMHAPSPGPADTVARMAQVVGLAPEELVEAGRADAAEKLRELDDPRSAAAHQLNDLDRRIARLKADPKTRRMLEAFVQMIEDNHPL